MKRNILFVAAAMMAMLATSCNKEEENTLGELKQMPITITAGYEGNNAKVHYTESGNTINATWETGDQILVVYDGYVSTLSLSTGAGTGTATFTGTISYRTTPSANSILYCFVKDVNNADALVDNGNGTIGYAVSYLEQDGTVAGAGKCNTYFGMATYGDGTNIKCNFSVNNSMLKFAISAPDGLTSDDDATLTYKSGDTELAKASFKVGPRGMKTIYMAIPSGSYSGVQTLVYKSGENLPVSRTLSSTHANFAVGQTYSKTLYFGHHIDLSYLNYDYTAANGDTLVNTLGSNVKISIAAGATVILRNASINWDGAWTTGNHAGLTCLGNAAILLEGNNNYVRGFNANYPGIHIAEGYELSIGSLSGEAHLNAGSNGNGAGIGGGKNIACGNITINNGDTKIWAFGGKNAAGIGSGESSSCGKIIINLGSVVANGGSNAAGIGTGYRGSCDTIFFFGGRISGYAGDGKGAGIGTGGDGTYSGNVAAIIIGNGISQVQAIRNDESAKCIGKGAGSGSYGFLYIEATIQTPPHYEEYSDFDPDPDNHTIGDFTTSLNGNTWTLRRTN